MRSQKQIFHFILVIAIAFLPDQLLGQVMPKEEPAGLELSHINGSKSHVIPFDHEVVVNLGSYRIKGTLQRYTKDSLFISRKEELKAFAFADINWIRESKDGFGSAIGVVLSVVGVGALALGGISLGVGLVAFFAEDVGALVLIAAPILLGSGYGLHRAGKSLQGQKFRLAKWQVSNSK